MSDLLSSLLMHPFEKEALEPLTEGQSVLLWGARPDKALSDLPPFDCLQNFKPYADEWAQGGIKTTQEVPAQKTYHAVLCVLPKQKDAAQYQLAQSLDLLEDGGLLMAVAANEAGGKRLMDWFKVMGVMPESLSKSKCKIVWARKAGVNAQVVASLITAGAQQSAKIEGVEYTTKPGVFGWNKIDLGSKILLETMTDSLSGKGADFGSGYGYLSQSILDGNRQIKKLYIIDADYDAIQCSKLNLKKYEEDFDIEYHWENLTKKPALLSPLDFIIMNPPFHEDKETSIQTGQKFIETAAASLRRQGKLYMVANAHLPYEKLLSLHFTEVNKIEEKQGFKIFRAVK